MRMNGLAVGIALPLAAALAACAASEMPGPQEGARIYADTCAVCHGPAGRGDGPLAGDLPQRPADLTRIAARSGGPFPRARVLSHIDGYTRIDAEGQGMPEFGLLLRGEPVPVDTGDGRMTPTPRPLAALLAYLEAIQRP